MEKGLFRVVVSGGSVKWFVWAVAKIQLGEEIGRESVYIYIYIYFLFFILLKRNQMSLLFVLHYVTSVFFLPKKTLNNLSYNSEQLNKMILFELYKKIKLDFLFKNLFLTFFLSKIFIKYYINLIKPIQLIK